MYCSLVGQFYFLCGSSKSSKDHVRQNFGYVGQFYCVVLLRLKYHVCQNLGYGSTNESSALDTERASTVALIIEATFWGARSAKKQRGDIAQGSPVPENTRLTVCEPDNGVSRMSCRLRYTK